MFPTSRRFAALLGLLAVAAAAVGLSPAPARGQEAPLEPLPRPITLFVLQKPTVTVAFKGDFGPAQLIGVLEQAPAGAILVRSHDGSAREASWGDLRQLVAITRPTEGAEKGWTATLMADMVPVRQSQGAGRTPSFYEQSGWSTPTLPEGSLRLTGKPYGTIDIPTAKVDLLRQEPVRGTLPALPDAPLRVQVLDGQPFTVSLADVVTYRRDVQRQLVTVTLADDQTFTARLVELPKVALAVATDAGPRSVPFEQIGLMERATPGGRLAY